MSDPHVSWIAEGPPYEEEATKWLTAHDARVEVSRAAGSRAEALILLTEAMIGGTISTRGVPSDEEHRRAVRLALGIADDDVLQRVQIEPSFWQEATAEDQTKWNWPAGEFCSTPINVAQPARYFDVQFPAFEIRGLCADNGLAQVGEISSQHPAAATGDNVGGRSSGKHGEPIAEAAIRLYKMNDDFNRVKGASLAEDLKEAYRQRKFAPPSEQNLVDISWGILRAVKAARNSQ